MKYYCFLFALLSANYTFTQTISPKVISTAGGEFENPFAKISYTIGEPVTETIDANGATMTQGFQQNDFNITIVEELKEENIALNVFPNPAQDYIKIQLEKSSDKLLNCMLYDIAGNMLYKADIIKGTSHMEVNFTTYAIGCYLLKISSDTGSFSKTYKIEKIR
jgi:hypothetical protein